MARMLSRMHYVKYFRKVEAEFINEEIKILICVYKSCSIGTQTVNSTAV